MNVTTVPLTSLKPGEVYSFLETCYAALLDDPDYDINHWRADWKRYDSDIHEYPDSVGASGFVTLMNEQVAGMMSWDPRGFPQGRIGHNLVLPEFQGRGVGRWQVSKAIIILQDNGFTTIRVATGVCDFFKPARKMYESCGFKELDRYSEDGTPFPEIEYGLETGEPENKSG